MQSLREVVVRARDARGMAQRRRCATDCLRALLQPLLFLHALQCAPTVAEAERAAAAEAAAGLVRALLASARKNTVSLSDDIDGDLAAELAYHIARFGALPDSGPAALLAALPTAPLLTGALCALTPHPDLSAALWSTALAALLVLPVPVEVAATGGDVRSPPAATDLDADEALAYWTPPHPGTPQRTLAVGVIAFASSSGNNTALPVRLRRGPPSPTPCTRLCLQGTSHNARIVRLRPAGGSRAAS